MIAITATQNLGSVRSINLDSSVNTDMSIWGDKTKHENIEHAYLQSRGVFFFCLFYGGVIKIHILKGSEHLEKRFNDIIPSNPHIIPNKVIQNCSAALCKG